MAYLVSIRILIRAPQNEIFADFWKRENAKNYV